MKNIIVHKRVMFPPAGKSIALQSPAATGGSKLCESVHATCLSSLSRSCSSITADQESKPPSKRSGLRCLIWWAWPGWSTFSTSDTQQTCDSPQMSSSSFPPLCLWSRAHRWEGQHWCLLTPGRRDKLMYNSYSKYIAEMMQVVRLQKN